MVDKTVLRRQNNFLSLQKGKTYLDKRAKRWWKFSIFMTSAGVLVCSLESLLIELIIAATSNVYHFSKSDLDFVNNIWINEMFVKFIIDSKYCKLQMNEWMNVTTLPIL